MAIGTVLWFIESSALPQKHIQFLFWVFTVGITELCVVIPLGALGFYNPIRATVYQKIGSKRDGCRQFPTDSYHCG